MPMFSASSLFSAYASLTALVTLIQQFYHQIVPKQVRNYISLKLEEWFTKASSATTSFTLVIEQFEDGEFDSFNQVYSACEAYLASKLRSTSTRLKVSRPNKKDRVSFKLAQGEKFSEVFEGIQLEWSFICNNATNYSSHSDVEDSRSSKSRLRNNFYFELSFDPDYKDKVLDSYLPYILKFYDDMVEKKKDLKLYTLDCGGGKSGSWRSVKFKHPFTFDALAMEPEVKKAVVDDLERFLGRREFYKKVGRAWKRGYLLYGPPGTGKSSLIAAMANHLKFDVYDLQLSSVLNDSVLRRLLLSTSNKSILVIEDIDCSLGLADRQVHLVNEGKDKYRNDVDMDSHSQQSQISLSGLLNFIDGLWSSCGDERIFVFTTNHKEKLDSALLRPGRMDMHINMSYLTMPAFRILALNYLNISGEHYLFKEIEELIQATKVSPAQVAEELIRSDDPDIALSSLVKMLKEQKMEHSPKKVNFTKLMNGKVGNCLGSYNNGVHDFSDDYSSD
ncbi:AAA-ATPase At3g50940-like isoform X2 [Chenopodium quinoa]|nr:AAA-ATPase At3g50940-like isoform X2 [Chenopodium quinoa]